MPKEIYLVKAGMTMTEGLVAQWYIADGESVETGQPLYALETEKITMDVDAEADGIVRQLIAEGVSCEPGQVVGYIYDENENIPDSLPVPGTPTDSIADLSAIANTDTVKTEIASAENNISFAAVKPVIASPIAKRLAKEFKLDLSAIIGTGPKGRIVEADIMAARAVKNNDTDKNSLRISPSARRRARELEVDLTNVRGTGNKGGVSKSDVEVASNKIDHATIQRNQLTDTNTTSIALSSMRKTIAKRMHQSLQQSAQLTMDMEVCMDEAVKLREQLIDEWKSENARPSITDLVIRSVIKALQAHPVMNSQMGETEIVLHKQIHLGTAVALDDGLIVPVIKNAQDRDLLSITRETSRLALAAKNGTLGIDDINGGTFTVSAMGMFGVDSFTPILNAPQVGILGVNRLYDGLGWEKEKPVRKKMMRLSLTWDHRVLDGAPAAKFLQTVCELLEAPYRLII